MRINVVVIKCFVLVLLSMGMVACSYMPETSEIFADQKETYKNAHELPPLEVPPELSSLEVKDDGFSSHVKSGASVSTSAVAQEPSRRVSVRVPPLPTAQASATVASTPAQKTIAKTTPLNNETKTTAEIIRVGSGSYLLVHDSFRNTWRKVVSALEALEYDIEDKNRDDSLIYLNIGDREEGEGMLSSLAFWKSSSSSTYLISFDQYSDGIGLEVQDEDEALVNDDVSKRIYDDLLNKLTK